MLGIEQLMRKSTYQARENSSESYLDHGCSQSKKS